MSRGSNSLTRTTVLPVALSRAPSVRPSASPRQRPSQPSASHPSGLPATYLTAGQRRPARKSLFGQVFRSPQRLRPRHQNCKGRRFSSDAVDPRPPCGYHSRENGRAHIYSSITSKREGTHIYGFSRLNDAPVFQVTRPSNKSPVEIAPPIKRPRRHAQARANHTQRPPRRVAR